MVNNRKGSVTTFKYASCYFTQSKNNLISQFQIKVATTEFFFSLSYFKKTTIINLINSAPSKAGLHVLVLVEYTGV